MKFKQNSLLTSLLAVLILSSCRPDDDSVQYAETPPFDRTVFSKIGELSGKTSQIWDGYDYLSSHSAYLIFTEDDGTFGRGYFINPAVIPQGSVKVDPAESDGLEIYRNDGYFEEAAAELEGGIFSFDFEVDGVSHFLLQDNFFDSFYNDYKNQDNNYIPLVMAHEMFHIYQFANWAVPDEWIQDIENYPLDEEMIALHLLLFDLMKEAYHAETSEEQLAYLRYYISIRAEMARLDPTETQLITTMGTYQELMEGTARYVEHFSALNSIFPEINNDPTHGWGGFLEAVDTSSALRVALAFRIWYHVGAAVTHLLASQNVEVESKYRNGQTPYQTASEFLTLSDEQLQYYLEEARTKVNWNIYQQRAADYASLP